MRKEQRILHVVTGMNRGGLERRLMDLYHEIDKNKYQFDFLCLSDEDGYFDEEIRKLGGRVFHLTYISLQNIKKISNQLKIFFREHSEYKIVHCHLNQWCGFVLKEAKLANIPVRIAHSRTSLETISFKNIIKNIVKLPVNYFSTHKMAVSRKAAMWLFGRKAVNNNEVYILPNAIKMSDFEFNEKIRKKYRKKLQIEKKIAVIHVGNIKPEKNHEFLIEIFSRIKAKEKKAVLILIGADNSKGKIEEIIEKKQLEKDIIQLGSRDDVNLLLQAGDIFIFPSLYEGFPGSVLEAQTSGLPCIISSSITDEVMITDRIIQLSLNDTTEKWANVALDIFNQYKDSRIVTNLDKKYDIKNSATILTNYYGEFID